MKTGLNGTPITSEKSNLVTIYDNAIFSADEVLSSFSIFDATVTVPPHLRSKTFIQLANENPNTKNYVQGFRFDHNLFFVSASTDEVDGAVIAEFEKHATFKITAGAGTVLEGKVSDYLQEQMVTTGVNTYAKVRKDWGLANFAMLAEPIEIPVGGDIQIEIIPPRQMVVEDATALLTYYGGATARVKGALFTSNILVSIGELAD